MRNVSTKKVTTATLLLCTVLVALVQPVVPTYAQETEAPSIDEIWPSAGSVGTLVVIYGANFSELPLENVVSFNGALAETLLCSTTVILTLVPEGATSGPLTVTVGGQVSNAVEFTVIPLGTPYLTQLIPDSGPVGILVWILGANLGSFGSEVTVTFNGVESPFTFTTGTEVLAVVPPGATTGPVVVVVDGIASNELTFTVEGNPAPFISSITPDEGPVGMLVAIEGENFGFPWLEPQVAFNGTPAPLIWGWPDYYGWPDLLYVAVPEGATSGPVTVTVGGQVSNGVQFTVTVPQPPVITALIPDSGPIYSPVIITGENLGGPWDWVVVSFNGSYVLPVYYTGTEIGVFVPPDATTGPVTVEVNGLVSNELLFTVTEGYWDDNWGDFEETPLEQPVITSIEPNSGAVGTSIGIYGENLTYDSGWVIVYPTVYFNGVPTYPFGWGTDSEYGEFLWVEVPVGATSGPVVVELEGLRSNEVYFTVTEEFGWE